MMMLFYFRDFPHKGTKLSIFTPILTIWVITVHIIQIRKIIQYLLIRYFEGKKGK